MGGLWFCFCFLQSLGFVEVRQESKYILQKSGSNWHAYGMKGAHGAGLAMARRGRQDQGPPRIPEAAVQL